MCGRFSQAESSRRLAAVFNAEFDGDLPHGKYNVAPTDPIRIVLERDGRRTINAAEWGFRPRWRQRQGVTQPGWINAKAETALESRAFGRAIRQQRCIIPTDAFYEWDRGHRPPQPYAIASAHPGGVLALAGIWTQTNDGFTTAAILTTAPNEVMESLHHRMPVMVAEDAVDQWLAADLSIDEIVPFLVPAPDELIRIWPVSTAVNSVRNDGPHLLRAIESVPLSLGLV